MQITLLPPLLPTDGVTSVPGARNGLVTGARIVATVAATTEGGVRTEFIVERPDAADAIEAGLHDLGGSLETAGFATVLSRVVVDPVRACAPDELPALPAPHAILDARA